MRSLWVVSILVIMCSCFGETGDKAVVVKSESLKKFNEVCMLDGNSSGFNSHSEKLKTIEKSSAKIVAAKLKCKPDQIIFTSSETMANNISVLGVAYKHPGCHLITCQSAHNSILSSFEHLSKQGYHVSYIDMQDKLDLEQLKKSISNNTKFVSIPCHNKQILVQLKDLAKLAESYPAVVFHLDITNLNHICDVNNTKDIGIIQDSAVKESTINNKTIENHTIDADISWCDVATIAGVGSPDGIAVLYIKERNKINPILFGSGDQLFPGSKPTALIASFAEAIREGNKKQKKELIQETDKGLSRGNDKKQNRTLTVSADKGYLDYAASARINANALRKFNEVCDLINNHSRDLKRVEQESIKIVANKLKCKPNQLVFTNSATMSNNLAVLGVAYKNPGCHLITSEIEHKSVLNVFKHLEQHGYTVSYVGVNQYGELDLEQLKRSINDKTRLVSIQSFNSEIGIQQNIKAIADIIRSHKNIVFHSDISQAFGKYEVDIHQFDMVTFSGYKIGAPKGIAALYIKDRNKIDPVLFGSGDRLFPGFKPVALIAAFAKAVEEYTLDLDVIRKNFEALREEVQKISKVYINSKNPSHVFSVSIEGVLLSDLIDRLKDFSFSSGCSCLGQGGESNVKQAIDPKEERPSTTLRISFSDKVSEKILRKFAQKLKKEVENLRRIKSVSNSCENRNSQEELTNVLMSL